MLGEPALLRGDRIALVALVIAAAGIIGPWIFPPAYLSFIPDQVRLSISIVCAFIAVGATMFLLVDLGKSYVVARIFLYITIFVVVMGLAMYLVGGQTIWVRGVIGALLGAVVLIVSPTIYPKAETQLPRTNNSVDNSAPNPSVATPSTNLPACQSVGIIDQGKNNTITDNNISGVDCGVIGRGESAIIKGNNVKK